MNRITLLNNPGTRYDKDAVKPSLPHILLVLDQFPRVLGGGERIVLKIAELLPKYGYRVSILTFFVHPDCSGMKYPPCPVYVLPLKRTYDWNALRGARELRRLLRSERIQIVQTFFESSDLWAGLITKMTSTAKLIWSRRDMGILRTRKHRIAYRWLAGVPDAVFAVSEQVRRHCIDVDGINPAIVQTIYNGGDLVDKIADRTTRIPSQVRVITLGNIRRVKGHDIFVRAAADVLTLHPGITFSVVGEVLEQDYFAELQTLVCDLNLVDHFSFVGGVSDPQNCLSHADIFVLPSRSEGFSNAIIEAMATSLPVIATAVGGNAEAVRDGVNGLIVPAGDFKALAAAIVRLVSDPSLARAMGTAGRLLAAEMFSTEVMMDKIVTTYKLLLAAS